MHGELRAKIVCVQWIPDEVEYWLLIAIMKALKLWKAYSELNF